MNRTIERLINGTPLYDVLVARRQRRELLAWLDRGRPCPPPDLVKQSVVKEYAARFGTGTMIETGTYLGFMVNAVKTTFRRIYTVELEETLFRRAAKKFARYGHITVLQGDSGAVLPTLLGSLREPCLFWLDAHHSSGAAFRTAKGDVETPIVSELKHILSLPDAGDHVILVDDAREFTGSNDYPTIAELERMVLAMQPGFQMDVRDDIVRIHRRQA